MQRFLIDIPLSERVTLEDADIVHQIGHVLRAAPGEEVVLFDGASPEEHVYRIERISKRAVECVRQETRSSRCEPAYRIAVAQAMPNTMEKLEYALQKCVEIGVARFVIFRADRSQKPLPAASKRDRLLRIAIEATEQCGGCVLPTIEYIDRLVDISLDTGHAYALDMGDDISTTAASDAETVLLVGPEGGWSAEERAHLDRAGIARVSLGQRVLRTETASVAALAAFSWSRDSNKKEG